MTLDRTEMCIGFVRFFLFFFCFVFVSGVFFSFVTWGRRRAGAGRAGPSTASVCGWRRPVAGAAAAAPPPTRCSRAPTFARTATVSPLTETKRHLKRATSQTNNNEKRIGSASNAILNKQ